jgi:D-alanyl-D-alanine carboxypeptidase
MIAFALSGILLAAVAPEPTASPGDLAARITAAAGKAIAAHRAPGGAVAVVRDGTVVYVRGFGTRNLATQAPVDADTRFEIGSVTKQFTAAAILQLKEAGKLSLDDRLSIYVPSFPHAGEITLRQLLHQTSGLPDYTDANGFIRIASKAGNLAKIEALIAKLPLHFKPGTRWEYSNTNYIALGRVVEVASGMPYATYVRTHVFAPAGMTQTTMIAAEPQLVDFATPYWRGEKGKGALAPAPPLMDVWAGAAGAIVSTVGDLAKWDLALQAGKIVTAPDLRLMTSSGALDNGKPTGYGFGWMIDTFDGHERVWHNGGTFGSSSSNVTFPTDGVDVIVLENLADAPTSGVADTIFETIFPEVAAAANQAAPGEDPAVTLRAQRLIDEAIHGSVPSSELAPAVAKILTPALQQQVSEQLTSLGPVKAVIFKQKIAHGDDLTYVYRVQFPSMVLNFIMSVNTKTNLLDGILFQPG